MFNFEKYNPEDFNATYSPEDNKLRLYADVRLDSEDWAIMKENGFKWAPKQELFVCYWSVSREDFMLKIAGDILPEEMTMVERAEAKADRLLLLAQKRSDQCVGYQRAANDLMMRLDNNQPILAGHHSQRKAEKTEKQVNRNIEKAKETSQAVGYWVWRAQGVIGHADYKNNTRTVYNRIKTLLKDLRTYQRDINEAARMLDVIVKVKNQADQEIKERSVKFLCGDWTVNKFELNTKIESGELTQDQALDKLARIYNNVVNSRTRARRIGHTLNRLAYEQGQLSLVSVFDGALTPAVIQTFLRTHGADKPKAEKTDYGWLAVSGVCLPLHLAASCELELDDQEWRDLMQSVGYEVPTKRTVAAKAPILNFKTDKTILWDRGYSPKNLIQIELTKEEYKRNGTDHNCTILSTCKEFRVRAGYLKVGYRSCGTPEFDWRFVFLTDSKVHPVPESMKTGQLELV